MIGDLTMKKIFASFVYAFNGIRSALHSERNFKIQVAIAFIVVAAGLYFRVERVEWCIIFIMIGLVLGFELMNSALEKLVDLVTQEHKPLAGKVKDFAAAAVLLVSILSAVVGVIVFWKYIF